MKIGFYKYSFLDKSYYKIELPISYRFKKIVIADVCGRWGYVSNDQCYFPIQYERSVDLLVEWEIKVSKIYAYMDGNDILYPLIVSEINEFDINALLFAERLVGSWRFNDNKGEMISHFHDVQGYFHEKRVFVDQKEYLSCYDTTGTKFFSFKNTEIGQYSEGYACIYKNNKCGYIDLDGKTIIKPQFDAGWNFHEGMASVKVEKKWGFINKSGQLIIKNDFNDASDFRNGLARVSFDMHYTFSEQGLVKVGKYGFINKLGELVIMPTYDNASDFNENKSAICINNLWGYINIIGKLIIQPQYSVAMPFNEDLACVKLNNKYGFTDDKGIIVIPFVYSKAFDFSENFAAVEFENNWGFLSKTGEWLIPPVYDDISSFKQGLARIRQQGKYGFIDKKCNWIISPIYDDATSFSEGMAQIKLGEEHYFINLNGEKIFSV